MKTKLYLILITLLCVSALLFSIMAFSLLLYAFIMGLSFINSVIIGTILSLVFGIIIWNRLDKKNETH